MSKRIDGFGYYYDFCNGRRFDILIPQNHEEWNEPSIQKVLYLRADPTKYTLYISDLERGKFDTLEEAIDFAKNQPNPNNI